MVTLFSMALGLILTSCASRAVVPDDQVLKDKGDSIKRLEMIVDCIITGNNCEDIVVPNDQASVAKKDITSIDVKELYLQVNKLIDDYKTLKSENAALQNNLIKQSGSKDDDSKVKR